MNPPHRFSSSLRALAIALLCSACLGDELGDRRRRGCREGLEPGQCAPDFTLPTTTGSVTLSSFRGNERVVVLGSATW